MTSGYVKSYRSIFEHWVADDPKMFMAWEEMTHAAAFATYTIEVSGQIIKLERGQVNISGLKTRRYFSDKQWRSFLERLVECQMIARSAVYPLGRGSGSIAIYDVLAYEKYQGNEERYDTQPRSSGSYLEGTSNGMSKGGAKGGPNDRLGREKYEDEGSPKGTSKGMSKGTPYNKNSKEGKEDNPLRVEDRRKKSPIGHEFDPETVELPSNFDRARFMDFCTSRLALKSPMTSLALRRFIAKHEKNSAAVLDRMFDNAIVSGWKDLYDLKPRELEELKATPKPESGDTARLPEGAKVFHPTHGVDEIRYYRQDGQIVLEHCGALVKPSEVTPCVN